MRKLLSEMSSDLGKYPNYKTTESESDCFFVLIYEIISESSFLIKSNINIFQKRIVKRFGLYFKRRSKKVYFDVP